MLKRYQIMGLSVLILTLLSPFTWSAPSSSHDKDNDLTLAVIDSYLEMRTGPGRGYPVFFVVEQGEQIQVLTRRPDWYEVSIKQGTNDDKKGWVHASQIARTLQATGEPADLPSVSYGDYAKNRWRVGFVAGQLSSDELKNAETFGANIGYYPLSWLGAEFEASKFYGNDVRGTQLNINAVIEPFSQWPLSPALLLGSGKTDIDVQPRLVPLEFETESHKTYGLRLNYYVGRNFIVRGEYRVLTIANTTDDEEFNIWNFGFNTLF